MEIRMKVPVQLFRNIDSRWRNIKTRTLTRAGALADMTRARAQRRHGTCQVLILDEKNGRSERGCVGVSWGMICGDATQHIVTSNRQEEELATPLARAVRSDYARIGGRKGTWSSSDRCSSGKPWRTARVK